MPSSLKSYVGKYIVFVQYCSSVAPKLAKYDDTIYVCICWKKNSNKYSKTQVSRYDKGHSVHAGMLQHVEIFTQNPRYYNFRFTLLFLRGSLAERIDALHRRSMREWPNPTRSFTFCSSDTNTTFENHFYGTLKSIAVHCIVVAVNIFSRHLVYFFIFQDVLFAATVSVARRTRFCGCYESLKVFLFTVPI